LHDAKLHLQVTNTFFLNMISIKQLFYKHPIWMTIVPYFILLTINRFGSRALKIDEFYRPHSLLILIGILLFAIYQFVPMRSVFVNWVSRKQWYFYLYPIIWLIVGLVVIAIYDKVNIVDAKYYIKNLAVGISEEFMFRSICFGLLIKAYTSKGIVNPIFRAGIYSSLAFGLFHSVNILNNPTSVDLWIATGFQLIYATLLGIGFAGFTYKTNSIVVPVLIHAVIDIFGDEPLFAPQIKESDTTPLNYVVLAFGLPFLIIGFYYLFQSKKTQITNI
jgi:membrane protease YdiL (CAAX protease family)